MYRMMLRTAHTTFRPTPAYRNKVLAEIRSHFESNRHETDDTKIAELCKNGRESAEFIAKHVAPMKVDSETKERVPMINRRHVTMLDPREGSSQTRAEGFKCCRDLPAGQCGGAPTVDENDGVSSSSSASACSPDQACEPPRQSAMAS